MRVDLDGYGPDHIASDYKVSHGTLNKLSLIIDLLIDWQTRMNLIGPAEFDYIWRRHIADSLQLLPHLLEHGTVVDFGSGAGFPGLVIAAAREKAQGEVLLVESTGKKCAFLREAITVADMPARVYQGRIESLAAFPAAAITARALAPLPQLLAYAAPWLEKDAFALFPKGRRWQEELTQAQESWTLNYEVIPSRYDSQSAILKVKEARFGRHSNTYTRHNQSEGRRREDHNGD